MMLRHITALLLALCCTSAYAMPHIPEPMLWLEPLTYQQMREMRDKANETAKSAMGNRSESAQSKNQTGTKKEEKKRSWSESDRRLRRIYLRSGTFPAQKRKMGGGQMSGGKPPTMQSSGSTLWLERPDNTVQGIKVKQRRSSFRGEYPADDGGWYRLFAYNDLGVINSSRVYLFSYYTFMSHGEEAAAQEPPPVAREGYFEGQPELALIRIYADGKPRYRNHVGDQIRVRALFRGQPVTGGRLKLTTQQGWRQMQPTDANGEATFTLIKEDFHADGVDRRKAELYMLRLEHQIEYAGGYYDSKRYIATLPFRVSPAKDDWQNQTLAYLAIIITIVGTAAAIAIRRRRRRLQ